MKIPFHPTALLAIISASVAHAHFQVLVPNTDLADSDRREIALEIIFTHPMAGGPAMQMGVPARFGVMREGKETDLKDSLKELKVDGQRAYGCRYRFDRPGDHVFFIEPAPYWEPAEEKMIIHYTKVVVNAFGEEKGWDRLVGFPVEIRPLVRPYGLWTGNVFRGVVLKNGKPVPFAEIEVEYWNREGAVKPPADAFITQVIKASADGTFTYAMPRAGWWAFAALIDGEDSMKSPSGKDVGTELGALMWVHCRDIEK